MNKATQLQLVRLAVEYGYKAHERGESLEKAIIEAEQFYAQGFDKGYQSYQSAQRSKKK